MHAQERSNRNNRFRWVAITITATLCTIHLSMAGPVSAAPTPSPAPSPPAAPAPAKPAAAKPAPAPVGPLAPVRVSVPKPGDIRTGPLADRSHELVTRDGWRVTVTKYGERLKPVTPLTRAAQSLEAFHDLSGEAKVEAADPKRKPTSRLKNVTIVTSIHASCSLTADSLTLGGDLSSVTTGAISPTIHVSSTQTGQGQGGSNGGAGGGSVSVTEGGSLNATATQSVGVGSSISGILKPGTTQTIKYAEKAVVVPNVQVTTRDVRIAIDNCAGQAAVRSVVTVTVSTDASDDSLPVLGEPLNLERR